MTHAQHALEIPELKTHLSKFLELPQLFTCTLVSKDWNASFTPALYNKVNLARYKTNPELKTLEKYSENVKILRTFEIRNLDYYSIRFNNITQLEIRTSPSVAPPPVILSQLIQNNKSTLKSVALRLPSNHEPEKIWSALNLCHRITDLFINTDISSEALIPFIAVCSRVSRLTFGRITWRSFAPFMPIFEHLVPFSNLTNFGYIGSVSRRMIEPVVLEIIRNSPNLMSLSLTCEEKYINFLYNENEKIYREIMTSRVYKSLTRLGLHGAMSDSDAAISLRAMTNATALHMSYVMFQYQAYTALIENHAHTIVSLNIAQCRGTPGSIVQRILSRCPSLIRFDADYIQGTDIARLVPCGDGDAEKIELGQDWVCLGLKELWVSFNLSDVVVPVGSSTEEENEAFLKRQQTLEQMHIYRQLSRLCSLEFLNIVGINHYSKPSLDLKLSSDGKGLEILKTLKNLRSFQYKKPIDYESFEWMRINFPKCAL